MRLRPIRDEILASHMHRSGWPFVMKSLEPLFDDSSSVIFDDFLEMTFSNRRKLLQDHVYELPWMGVVHHCRATPNGSSGNAMDARTIQFERI